MPTVTYVGNLNAPTEDSAITATQGTIEDPDNTPTTDLGSTTWIWSQADTHGGAYTPVHPLAPTFTPLQAHVGKFLQICVRFRDNANNDEERCLQIATAVANVDDAPVSLDNTIYIAPGTTFYRFKTTDFPFEDEDGDVLTALEILTLPANGTLETNGGRILQENLDVRLISGRGIQLEGNSIPTFAYRLPGTAMPDANYASFRFKVGAAPAGQTSGALLYSDNPATITFAIAPDALRLRLRLFLEGPLR